MSDRLYNPVPVQNEVAGSRAEKPTIPQKSVEVLDGVTCLYRHFDADGALLYIGISLNTIQRLAHHRQTAAWFDQIVRIEIERFPTRADAIDAEVRAIRKERPIYNRAGMERWKKMELELQDAMDAMTPEDWAALQSDIAAIAGQ